MGFDEPTTESPGNTVTPGSPLDCVTECLRETTNSDRLVPGWMMRQEHRALVNRQATSCVIRHGGMLALTATLSSVAAWILARSALDALRTLHQEIVPLASYFSTSFYRSSDSSVSFVTPFSLTMLRLLPILLMIVAVLISTILVLGWWFNRLPGHRSTLIALDCSTAADAMGQMTRASVPYDKAFRVTQGVVLTDDLREWLGETAERVSRGQELFDVDCPRGGDLGLLEMMLQAETRRSAEDHADRWRLGSIHFAEVAQKRTRLLTQFFPPLATILSGILAWMAVAGTQGVLWRIVGRLVNPGGGGF